MGLPEMLEGIHDKLDALIEHAIATKPPPPEPVRPKADLSQMIDLLRYIRLQYKIEAIKELRSITGCGLKEAKDAIEIALGDQP